LIDFLIIGQGLAGTLVAHNLQKHNKTFRIIDAIQYEHPIKQKNNFTTIDEPKHPFNAATFSSTGTINPITGRRFVKTWLLESLLPAAIETYQHFEKQFNQSFIKEVKIFRTIPDQRADNDLALRINDEAYQAYFETENPITPNETIFNITKKGITLKNAAIVNVYLLVRCFREYLTKENLFNNENISIDDIKLNSDNTFTLNNQSYKNLVFCEGYRVIQNPYFNNIPFTVTNGQIVIIKSTQIKIDYLLKSGVFIIPQGNDVYKVGTTWDWDLQQPQTTEAAIAFFKKHLDELLKVPYEIIAHQAAVRPTIKDRRPVMGEHLTHKNMFLFNGLGAKGVSLAPYFSEHLVTHILSGGPLMKEVEINRFFK